MELDETEKQLLVNMLASDGTTDDLEKVFTDKATQLRLDAEKTKNPIEKIKLKDAADAFEDGLQRLRRIRGYRHQARLAYQAEAKLAYFLYSFKLLTFAAGRAVPEGCPPPHNRP